MVWHNCKTDPPKESGEYLLWYFHLIDDDWDKAYYNVADHEWLDSRACIPYGNPDWGWSDSIPYKWAEVDLSEVE